MRLLERIEEVYAIGDRVGYSPDEHSDPEDIVLAVDVLAAALSRLAE